MQKKKSAILSNSVLSVLGLSLSLLWGLDFIKLLWGLLSVSPSWGVYSEYIVGGDQLSQQNRLQFQRATIEFFIPVSLQVILI